eukprot:1137061-Pelagomonas_calceolata.AAC.7
MVPSQAKHSLRQEKLCSHRGLQKKERKKGRHGAISGKAQPQTRKAVLAQRPAKEERQAGLAKSQAQHSLRQGQPCLREGLQKKGRQAVMVLSQA